jgi:glycosyltransferase involved in cell wall biosynthesis
VKTIRSLYVSYFGLREPLVQRQVLPYLTELARDLAGVSLLTFEPVHPARWNRSHRAALVAKLGQRGIGWSHLRYHKRPTLPATVLDILVGALRVARLARRDGISIVHCRGHVPMAMGTLAKKLCRVRLVFDIRGFMPEEYVDAGVWPADGLLYRLTKRVERRLLDAADAFVVLTERARRHLFAERRDTDALGRPLAVIPCCVDLRDFAAPDSTHVTRAKSSLGVEGRRVYVYAGQLGGWYLDDTLVAFLARVRSRDPATFAMILTPSPADGLTQKLVVRGFGDTNLLVRAVSPEQVPDCLLAADVGLSFIKPGFSKISSSPTKIGEYLAAGLPVVSTAGIGDVDELLAANRAGWLLRGFDDAAYDDAVGGIERLMTDRCLRTRLRDVASQNLDLQSVGGPLYRRLYAQLARDSSSSR